jgi:hypothetical protein
MSRGKPKQAISVAVQDFCLVCIADAGGADECDSLRARIVRIIYREHDPVDTKLGDAAGEGRLLEVAAGGEVEMLAKRIGESRLAPDIADDPVAAP